MREEGARPGPAEVAAEPKFNTVTSVIIYE